MEKEENMEMKKGGIINFFDGATINNLVINGNMTKSGTEHFCSRNGDMKEEEETDTNRILTPDQLAKAVGKSIMSCLLLCSFLFVPSSALSRHIKTIILF